MAWAFVKRLRPHLGARKYPLGAALGRVPRGGSWSTGIAILRIDALIQETPAGFVLSGALRAEVEKAGRVSPAAAPSLSRAVTARYQAMTGQTPPSGR